MRVHIVVTGRVQGVGFRYFTAARARALGLAGVARNLPNGQVEVVAEGQQNALEALIGAVRHGPAGAVVWDVQVRWGDVPPGGKPGAAAARGHEFVIR